MVNPKPVKAIFLVCKKSELLKNSGLGSLNFQIFVV